MSAQEDPLAEPDDDSDDAAIESPEPEGDVEPVADPPKRKRRKKRGRRAAKQAEVGSTPARDELDENGRERPRFLLEFPADPELEQLIAAFENGNYARVRELAPKLMEHAETVEVRQAAAEIRRRIEPDPLLKYLLLASSLLLVVLVWYAYTKHGVHAH